MSSPAMVIVHKPRNVYCLNDFLMTITGTVFNFHKTAFAGFDKAIEVSLVLTQLGVSQHGFDRKYMFKTTC